MQRDLEILLSKELHWISFILMQLNLYNLFRTREMVNLK